MTLIGNTVVAEYRVGEKTNLNILGNVDIHWPPRLSMKAISCNTHSDVRCRGLYHEV